jgi:hypothetical protein
MSPQTKSFIVLLLLAVVGSAGVLCLSRYVNNLNALTQVSIATNASLQKNIDNLATRNDAGNISTWNDYTDDKYDISFKLPNTWMVSTYDTDYSNFHIIILDPGNNQDHIRIYVAKKGYFAADGLTKEKTKVAGIDAWSVQDILFGVKNKSAYFTFDLGSNLKLKPEFQNIISSVAFNQ